jgi:dihydroflavonol-4-reductase
METIGITGANGLVGSYFLRFLLAKGYRIRALKRTNANLGLVEDVAEQVTWIDGDINDPFSLETAFEGCNLVIHAAALVSYSASDRDRLFKVNTEGTANVVNVCLQLGIPRLLYISSIATLGRKGQKDEVVTEALKWQGNKGVADYGLSKHYAEREVWRGMAEGLEVVVVNPSVILGSGDWTRGSSRLFTTVAKGFPFYTDGMTGFVDVRDVVEATWLLHEKNLVNDRFIINTGNYPYKMVFDLIADAMKKKGPTIKAGKFLSSIAWRMGVLQKWLTGKSPTVTRATARIASASYRFSHQKLVDRTGFSFRPIETTIKETGQAYLNYRQHGKTQPLSF